MAGGSKRSRKDTGKRKATGQTSQPEPVFNYGNFLWFPTREMLLRFKSRFEKREILPPRYMPLGNLENLYSQELLPHLDACHLSPFISNPITFMSKPLIRAFFSNLFIQEGTTTIGSTINGTEIYLSEERLNFLTLLPCVGENADLYNGTEDNPFNEILFLNEMGLTNFVPTQRRRPSVTRSMDPMYRTLLYLITRILKPRKYSHTTLTKEDTRLMHAIVNDVPINWCKFILGHMANAAMEDDKPLPYAPLVMQILEQHHIDMTEAPKTKGTQLWQVSISSFKGQEEEEAPRRRQQPVQPVAQQVDFTSIMEKLSEMQLGINERFNIMDEKFNTMSSQMHGYFESVGYTGYKEDIGQSSHGQDQEVGMGEEEEENDEDDEETPSKSF